METPSAAPIVTPTPKKPSNKCQMEGCHDRCVKIIGDCRYCSSKFCGKHRLPEAHACSNLSNCRQESASRLTNKLMGEKCVSEKV